MVNFHNPLRLPGSDFCGDLQMTKVTKPAGDVAGKTSGSVSPLLSFKLELKLSLCAIYLQF